MGFRFYRRTNLFGGLGINWSKSGPSLSVRTPFGSINSKGGVSIRTGITGLQYRTTISDGSNAKEILVKEWETIQPYCEEFTRCHEQLKQFNGTLSYGSDVQASTNERFLQCLSDMQYASELGHTIIHKLSELESLSRSHRTGTTGNFRNLITECNKLLSEVDSYLSLLTETKEKTDREEHVEKMVKRDSLTVSSQPQSDKSITIFCYQCEQKIDINADAVPNTSFNCPTCQTELFVPQSI